MHQRQRASENPNDVPARQAKIRAERNGEPSEEAVDGQQPEEEKNPWQEALDRKRARELDRERSEERNRARIAAAWKPFIQSERRELELRKDGQLARLLGDPLPGEPPEALQRLASEDRRQAEQGLVALTSNGKVFYKRVDELSPEDMPARGAARRLRTTWLKERSDRWLGHGEHSP
ncbi:MAG TPA: hypothetical protein VGP38_02375 [Rubrobacter sp.]|nr:hypothetical protein [Rubrobacter sp.]